MKILKGSATGLAACAVELLAGTLLLLDPVKFTSTVITGVGIILIVLGLADGVKYFKADAKDAAMEQMLTKSLIFLLAGVFCAVRQDWFVATFPVLTILYGMILLLAGISKIQSAVDLVRLKSSQWGWPAINAAVTLICGVVTLTSPFPSAEVLWLFTGAALVGTGIFDLIIFLRGRHKTEEPSP